MKKKATTSAHTAGPWNTFDYGDKKYPWIIIEDKHGFHVAAVERAAVKDDPSAANACLIAAAPELLNALKMAVLVIAENDRSNTPEAPEIYRQCTSAIAKAEEILNIN